MCNRKHRNNQVKRSKFYSAIMGYMADTKQKPTKSGSSQNIEYINVNSFLCRYTEINVRTTLLFFTVISSTIAGRIDFHPLIGNNVQKKSHFPPILSAQNSLQLHFYLRSIQLCLISGPHQICGIVKSVFQKRAGNMCVCACTCFQNHTSVLTTTTWRSLHFSWKCLGTFAIRVLQYRLAFFLQGRT